MGILTDIGNNFYVDTILNKLYHLNGSILTDLVDHSQYYIIDDIIIGLNSGKVGINDVVNGGGTPTDPSENTYVVNDYIDDYFI